MAIYNNFARVYDRWMNNIPYTRWGKKIIEILHTYNIHDGIILDLGCGSGRITRKLADAGYDMIGIDASDEMLTQAVAKSKKHPDILYLCQDMREFELYGTVKAVVCCCDTLNYLADKDELTEVFKLVNNYLDPDGIFIFDIKTPVWYEEADGLVDARHEDKGDFYCETFLDGDEFEYHVTMFEKTKDELYEKFEEYHYQKLFTKKDIENSLIEAKLELMEVIDDYKNKKATDKSYRLCFIAKECGKSGK